MLTFWGSFFWQFIYVRNAVMLNIIIAVPENHPAIVTNGILTIHHGAIEVAKSEMTATATIAA